MEVWLDIRNSKNGMSNLNRKNIFNPNDFMRLIAWPKHSVCYQPPMDGRYIHTWSCVAVNRNYDVISAKLRLRSAAVSYLSRSGFYLIIFWFRCCYRCCTLPTLSAPGRKLTQDDGFVAYSPKLCSVKLWILSHSGCNFSSLLSNVCEINLITSSLLCL